MIRRRDDRTKLDPLGLSFKNPDQYERYLECRPDAIERAQRIARRMYERLTLEVVSAKLFGPDLERG